MGACFNTVQFDGKLTPAELKKTYDAYIDEQRDEHGSGAYSGTLATCQGLAIESHSTFEGRNQAFEYIENKQQKWEAALAVKYVDTKTVKVKEPTFGGKKIVEDGQWHSMDNYHLLRLYYIDEIQKKSSCFAVEPGSSPRSIVVVPADQLAAGVKVKLKKLVESYMEAREKYVSVVGEFNKACRLLSDLTMTVDKGFWTVLKATRKSASGFFEKKNKLAKAIGEFEAQYRPKLYQEKTEKGETYWLIGGWCSE